MLDTSNPVLDEIDALSPPAKAALHGAHQQVIGAHMAPAQPGIGPLPGSQNSPMPTATMGSPGTGIGVPGTSVPGMGTIAPGSGGGIGPTSQPGGAGVQAPAPMASPGQAMRPATGLGGVPSNLAQDKSELARLQSTGSGISQIHNGFARGLLGTLGAVGGAFLPGLEQRLPGTEGHHQLLINQAQKAVAGDTAADLSEARAADEEAKPELARTKQELDYQKSHATQDLNQQKLDEKTQHDAENIESGLRRIGYTRDQATGDLRPQRYEEMDPFHQGKTDLMGAQEELASARKDYVAAQKNNEPMKMQIAMERVKAAEKNQSLGWAKLGLQQENTNARLYGTGKNGESLPGALETESGQPVGSINAPNVRPTGQQRGKGDLAASAQQQIETMRGILTKNPAFIGPVGAATNSVKSFFGSGDPDARAFKTAQETLGEHAAAMFGSRNAQVMKNLQSLSSPSSNPAEIKAALDQLESTTKHFSQAGTPRTVGSNALKAQPTVTPPAHGGGDTVQVQIPGMPPGPIHRSRLAEFQKKYPNAKVLQ